MRFSTAAIAAATLVAVVTTSAPAKDIYTLFTAQQSQTINSVTGGQFIVQQTTIQPTGTGVINSFVRVRDNAPAVQGYNTDFRPGSPAKAPLDDIDDPNFTRSLLLADVPIVTIGGVQYRQFLLDINQTGSNPKLSLNQIQIFQSNGDALHTSLSAADTTHDAVVGFGAGVNEVFRMNNAQNTAGGLSTNREIQLDFSLANGSGSGDMFLYVRNDAFNSKTNVILYSQFGTNTGQFENNDGYEEWSVVKGTFNVVPVPAPPSAILLGVGAVVMGIGRLRRRAAAKA